jgi:hypothetical protein
MLYEDTAWEEVTCEGTDAEGSRSFLFKKMDPKEEYEVPLYRDMANMDGGKLPSAFFIRLSSVTCPNCGFQGVGKEVFKQEDIEGPRWFFDFRNRRPFLKQQKELEANQIEEFKYEDIKKWVPEKGFVRITPKRWDGVICKKCSSAFVVQLLATPSNTAIWSLFSAVASGDKGIGFPKKLGEDLQNLYNIRMHQFIEAKGLQKEAGDFVCYGPPFKNP